AAAPKSPFIAQPALAACFLLFCSVSWAAAPSPDGMNAWFCGGSGPVLSVSSGAVAAPGSADAMKDDGEDSLSAPKPEGTHRIFVVGESPAGLLGPGEKTPLNAVFESIFPDGRLELINCAARDHGEPGITDVFEKALAYEPDLVVVPGGNAAPGPGPRFRGGPGAERSDMAPEDAEAGAVLRGQEGKLRGMARLARAKGVPVVFFTMPANMRDYAPSGDLPFEQAWLLKGMALLEKKDFAAALKFLELNLKLHPREAFSLFYAGRALDGLGRAKDAAVRYSAALKYDPARDRFPAERNEMVRRAAAEEGACVADLERAFSGIAADGITGGAALADGSHWFPEYDVFVSSVIGRAVTDCAPGGKSPAGVTPAPAAPPVLDEYAAEDFRAVFYYTVAYLSTGTFCDAPANERTVACLKGCTPWTPQGLRTCCSLLPGWKSIFGEALRAKPPTKACRPGGLTCCITPPKCSEGTGGPRSPGAA
ncbi:MAG: hypothetical protein WCK76_13635, partial [Elusimicrobiota bacterium]